MLPEVVSALLLWYSLALWDDSLKTWGKKNKYFVRWEAEVLKCVNTLLAVLLCKTPSFCVLFGVFFCFVLFWVFLGSLCDFWSVIFFLLRQGEETNTCLGPCSAQRKVD